MTMMHVSINFTLELLLDGLQVLWELGGGVHADLGEEGEGVRV